MEDKSLKKSQRWRHKYLLSDASDDDVMPIVIVESNRRRIDSRVETSVAKVDW